MWLDLNCMFRKNSLLKKKKLLTSSSTHQWDNRILFLWEYERRQHSFDVSMSKKQHIISPEGYLKKKNLPLNSFNPKKQHQGSNSISWRLSNIGNPIMDNLITVLYPQRDFLHWQDDMFILNQGSDIIFWQNSLVKITPDLLPLISIWLLIRLLIGQKQS